MEESSISFYECTSARSHLYLNIIAHGSGSIFWNLGLARITGSLNAERCVEILKENLKDNEIYLASAEVCIRTDGASFT